MFQVLALEIDGPVIRCAVVARTGLKKVNISQCESFARLEEEGAPLSGDELAMVTASLSVYPRHCVVVSGRAVFLQVALPVPGKGKRKLHGKKLAEALRLETEAYTGMAAEEMLLGFERLPQKEKNDYWVTAYPLEEYRQLASVLKESDLFLKRVYPPDCCFPVAAMLAAAEGMADSLVLDAGSSALRFARLEEGRLQGYRTVPLFAEQPYRDFTREDWQKLFDEQSLELGEMGQSPLLVSGPGSLDKNLREFLQEYFGLAMAELALAAGEPAKAGECGGDYASVVGAGLRELLYNPAQASWYFPGRALGVSDQPPFLQAMAQKAYLFPVTVILLSFLVFGGHYFLIDRQIKTVKAEMEVLSRERDSVRSAVARMQEEEKKVKALTEESVLLTDKVDYLQNRLPEYGMLLHGVLAALDAEADTGIKFIKIELLDRGGQFIVSGESADSGSIHRLAVALQLEEWCAFAKVEEIIREVREEEAEEDAYGLPEEEFFEPPPEAGLLPGEELPEMDFGRGGAMASAEPLFPDKAGWMPGEELPGMDPGGGEMMPDDPLLPEEGLGAEPAAGVVFKFMIRVKILPEFFPERPFTKPAEEESRQQRPTRAEGDGRVR